MDKIKVADYILDKILSAGADMGECRVGESVKTEVYYESGKISMLRSTFNTSVSLKVVKDKRKGLVRLNSVDLSALDSAVASAMAAAASAAPDDAEGIAELTENRSFTKGRLSPDREELYTLMRGFIDDVKAAYPKISFDSVSVQHNRASRVYKNTAGVCLESDCGNNGFGAMFMALEKGKTSSFNFVGAEFSGAAPIIEQDMVRTVLEQTERQIDTRTLSGKFEGEIIITPLCLPAFLGRIENKFLSDFSLIDGTSIWKDALDTQVASDLLTWHCRPTSDQICGGSFVTHDGYATADMTVIEKGVLKNFELSRYGAAKTGRKRSPNYGGYWFVEPGEHSLEQLVSGVKKGLLLNRFSGGSTSPNGDVTGVAKNSFLIENGKITDALSEVMLSCNLASLLKNITGISRERVNDGNSLLPWIKASGVTISGK